MAELKNTLTVIRNGQYNSFSESLLSTLVIGIEAKAIEKLPLCKTLKKKGLTLLFKTLCDPKSERIRKLSAKLICSLANESEESQQYICDNFAFSQLYGKVCINPVPDCIKEQIKADPTIVKEIREGKGKVKGAIYCWSYPTYNVGENEPFEANSIDFPDPLTHLIGFFSPEPEKPKRYIRKSLPRSPATPTTEKTQTSHTARTPTISPPPEKISKTSAFCTKKGSAKERQKWSKSLHIPEASLEEEEATGEPQKTDAEIYPEVVVEEEPPGKFVPAGSGSESSSKLKSCVAEEVKSKKVVKSVVSRLYQTQRIGTNATKKKPEKATLNMTQTLPSTKNARDPTTKFPEKRQNMYATLRPHTRKGNDVRKGHTNKGVVMKAQTHPRPVI